MTAEEKKETAQEKKKSQGRRTFLKYAAGAVVVAAVGGAAYYAGMSSVPPPVSRTETVTMSETVASTVAPPVTSPAAKQFEGMKLSFIGQSGPPADSVQAFASVLKDKYGMDITVESVPWEVWWSKLTTELISGAAAYDFVYVDGAMVPPLVELNALQPIDDLVERDKAEIPSLDQFSSLMVDYTTYGGKRYSWPYTSNFNELWVRKDLVEDPKEQDNFEKQYGYPLSDFVKQPDWLKFNDVIKFFHRPPDLYGYTQPMVWPQLTIPSWHTRWYACTGKPEVDEKYDPWWDRMGKYGILSVELLKYQLKFMPPGVLNMDNPDAAAVFLQGKAAVMTGWDSFCLFQLMDPSVNKVYGKVLHLPPPGGPKGWAVYTNIGHSLGITTIVKDPQRREACWTAIKTITNPETEPWRVLDPHGGGQPPATKRGWELLMQQRPDAPIQHISEYLTHSASVAYGPFVGDMITAFQGIMAPAFAGQMTADAALKALAQAYRKMYKPYTDKGMVNTHGLNVPPWPGEDFTDKLAKQIGM